MKAYRCNFPIGLSNRSAKFKTLSSGLFERTNCSSTNTEMELEQLLELVSRGDEDAFKRLYDRTSGKIHAIALLILKNSDAAEEIVQETYLKIWRQAPRYDATKGTPMAWMTTIVRRLAIDRIRYLKRQGKTTEALSMQAELLVNEVVNSKIELSDNIWACIERLAKDRATLILLAFFAGYTHEELAENAKKPLGTVKSSIRRGLKSLKECLET